MATNATSPTIATADTTVSCPVAATGRPPHQRLVVLNTGANTVWVRVDNATAAAVAGADEHVAILAGGVVELDPVATFRAIAVGGASVLNVWGRQ